ncbi:hypothetical protein ABIE45_004535 [Methylobacterium sp. OAE515]|uniref:phage tail tip lysozyme n=1 Tax=Methylobacterium sp. OAE515 TaxID=2817895 RepID=UPI001789C7F5
MADEALRMQAEVTDRFTGPLKALRAQLLDVSRTGANHSETLTKGFGAVEGALQKTARTASSVVNPAFAALGITGLTAGAAVAGISAALNKLNGNLTGLGQLHRETGIAAKTLQEFGAVAGRFGIEQDAVASGAKNFAAQMRTFSIGTGEAFNWVIRQGRDAAGRKAFQDFATDLQHTSDEGEKLKKALAFMETIRNPVERGIFAQQFFGNSDLARLADGHLGKVVDLFKKAREKIGVFNPDDIINAEKFDRSISDLRGSMSRFGLLIARELLGPATQFTTWINELVSDQRGDLLKGLREGLQEVKKELVGIDWKQAGDDSVAFLKESTRLAGALATAFHEVAEAIHAIREGEYMQALRGADGASGPLARKLAPRAGDDEIDAQERVDRLRKMKDVAAEAQGHAIGRLQQRLGVLDTPEKVGKDLEEAEARLKVLRERSPEQRRADFTRQQNETVGARATAPIENRIAEIQGRLGNFESMERAGTVTDASRKQADALREEMQKLTIELKRLREKQSEKSSEATAQKSSAESEGPFAGARVQTASFGGGGGFRRIGGFGGGYGGGANLPSGVDDPVIHGGPQVERRGGSGPGYLGERGPSGLPGRGFGGGRFNGLGGSRSGLPPIGPRPDVPSIAPSAGRRGARAERGGGAARTGEMMAYAMDQLRREGVPEERLREAAAHLVGQATMESGLDPNKVHDGGTGYGIYGARDPKGWGTYRGARRSDMVRWLEANGFSRNSAEGQMREMAHRAMSGTYPRTRSILLGRGSGDLERDTNTITGEFESPAIINRRSGAVREALRVGPNIPQAERADSGDSSLLPNGTPRVLKPNSMPDAPGVTMDEASRQRETVKGGFVRRAEVLADPSDERRRGEKPFYSDDDDRRAARDLGIALRATRAKQDAQREQMRMDGARVGAAAAQAGVVGSPVNGSVTNIVEKPGPDTKIKTKVDGNLFQEVRTQNGAQMRKAD